MKKLQRSWSLSIIIVAMGLQAESGVQTTTGPTKLPKNMDGNAINVENFNTDMQVSRTINGDKPVTTANQASPIVTSIPTTEGTIPTTKTTTPAKKKSFIASIMDKKANGKAKNGQKKNEAMTPEELQAQQMIQEGETAVQESKAPAAAAITSKKKTTAAKSVEKIAPNQAENAQIMQKQEDAKRTRGKLPARSADKKNLSIGETLGERLIEFASTRPGVPNGTREMADFDILISWIKVSEMFDTLTLGNDFTLIAPTDAALSRLGKDTLTALEKNPDILSKILRYHVHQGNNELKQSSYLNSLNQTGIQPRVYKYGGVRGIIDANGEKQIIISDDIILRNGRIIVIDGIILPELSTEELQKIRLTEPVQKARTQNKKKRTAPMPLVRMP